MEQRLGHGKRVTFEGLANADHTHGSKDQCAVWQGRLLHAPLIALGWTGRVELSRFATAASELIGILISSDGLFLREH